MILPVVRHNLGIGFIPQNLPRKISAEELYLRSILKNGSPERDILLVYDTEYPQSIAAKTFRNT